MAVLRMAVARRRCRGGRVAVVVVAMLVQVRDDTAHLPVAVELRDALPLCGAEDGGGLDGAPRAVEQLGVRVQTADRLLEQRQLRLGSEVELVEQHDVGALHLLAHQVNHLPRVVLRVAVRAQVLPLLDAVPLLELCEEGGRVDDGDEGVEAGAVQVLRHGELRVLEVVADLARLRHARGLDDDVVPLHVAPLRAPHHRPDRLEELLAERAARAAVGELNQVLLLGEAALARRLARDERLVDVDRRHVVDDDADQQPGLVLEQVLEQRRLARSEEARDQRHRHDVMLRLGLARTLGGRLGHVFSTRPRLL
mmetsp:Transcript_21922/g.71194  ORF Transcript_21922/g.71194 Transcript_21922/m.71194 type:complete len:310 (+) Transcript_21922:1-930(+)